ncbi:MAG: DUF484 family protein, partial [Gammaproteobacteria bacterium]
MSTPCDQAETVDEQAVVDYLSRHPDFFVKHGVLLGELELPHETGAATSLIERQVAVLRHHNHQYRHQLQELVRIAQDNDKLIERLQQLTLALLDTDDLAQIVGLLRQALQADFHAEAAVLHLMEVPSGLLEEAEADDFLRIAAHDAADTPPAEVGKIVARRKPVCGKFSDETLAYLFGEQAAPVASAALLPLGLGETM